MSLFHFSLSTPERKLFSGEVESISLPSVMGEITVLAHHETLMAQLVPGELRFQEQDGQHILAIGGGFVEVQQRQVVVLADTAERLDEIDEQRALEARKRAEAAIAEQRAGEEEYAETAALLERNLARLKIVRKHRTKHRPHID